MKEMVSPVPSVEWRGSKRWFWQQRKGNGYKKTFYIGAERAGKLHVTKQGWKLQEEERGNGKRGRGVRYATVNREN